MRAMGDLGVGCPGDVSLIGIDDFDWVDEMRIRPTLIAQRIEEMTEPRSPLYWNKSRIPNFCGSGGSCFHPKLIERGSCAPASRG